VVGTSDLLGGVATQPTAPQGLSSFDFMQQPAATVPAQAPASGAADLFGGLSL